MGQSGTATGVRPLLAFVVCLVLGQVSGENLSQELFQDRCKDDSFCKAYCLSTNPETVSARCGRDLASCICITPDNHAVKVRFVEERSPVQPTTPTTQRPSAHHSYNNGVQYVNSQAPLPSNYNGQNSIASSQQQNPPTPVLLECDASEASTRMCHLFCTMEIRAWYGLCNITSRACACFGVPLSVVQNEPIAAIFHSTAPVTPTPPPQTTPKPLQLTRPGPGFQYTQPNQYHPPQPQPQQYQQQQWRPVEPPYQGPHNGYYPSPPTILGAAGSNNQLQEQGPVRPNSGMFGGNGQPSAPPLSSFTPTGIDDSMKVATPSVIQPTDSKAPAGSSKTTSTNASNLKVTSATSDDEPESENAETSNRRRRSINEFDEGKETPSNKDLLLMGDCTKFKCALACKRNNYFAPDCTPKCREGECMCECVPRL